MSRTQDDELRQQELFGLVAFVLKHRKTADFAQFLHWLMPWVHQVEIRDSRGAVLGRIVLRYVIDRSSQGDKDLLVQEAQHYLSHELQGEIMTIAQQWEQQGIQKGLQQGLHQGMTIAQQWKEEGLQQGEAVLLIRLLQRRFGKLPAIYVERIAQADAQTLLHWGDNVLDARTLDDVFNPSE